MFITVAVGAIRDGRPYRDSCEEYFLAASGSRVEKKHRKMSCALPRDEGEGPQCINFCKNVNLFCKPSPLFRIRDPLTAFVSL